MCDSIEKINIDMENNKIMTQKNKNKETKKLRDNYSKGELAKEIFKALAFGGILAASLALPNLPQVLKFLGAVGAKDKYRVKRTIYNLKEKIAAVKVKGVKGVKQVLPVKRDEEYVVLTSGTNLKEILEMSEVDTSRTVSNDINEVCENLGIEAARQAIINEVYKVIESQGLNIDIRHIMLVADIMCAGGDVKGITRYGVVSEKASALARASFETPIKHIINAALEGEIDYLTSVVENVMINQPVPLGTGLPGLVTKLK